VQTIYHTAKRLLRVQGLSIFKTLQLLLAVATIQQVYVNI
jgi:hypothetical protein